MAGQGKDHLGHLGRIASLLPDDAVQQRLHRVHGRAVLRPHRGVGALGGGAPVSAHAAGLQGGHPDAEGRQFLGQHFGETAHGPFRRLVGAESRMADAPAYRRHLEDVAGALLAHDRHHRPGEVHHPEEIGFHLVVEIGSVHLLERHQMAIAGIVHQHIQAAPGVQGGLDRGLACLRIGHVQGGDAQRLRVAGCQIGEGFGIPGAGQKPIARRQNRFGDGAAQATGSPSQQPNTRHDHLLDNVMSDCSLITWVKKNQPWVMAFQNAAKPASRVLSAAAGSRLM